MKKTTLITGALIIVGSFIGSSTFAADTTNQNTRRDRIKTQKTQIIAYSGDTLPSYTGGLFIELSESEHEALKNMTAEERKAFLISKWVSLPQIASGSLERSHKKLIKLSDTEETTLLGLDPNAREKYIKEMLQSGSGNTLSSGSVDPVSQNNERKARIAKKQAELLEIKKGKIQKKINAGENLTRLEKKFAKEEGLIYE